MVELPKKYRAKVKGEDKWVSGYYFQYPDVTDYLNPNTERIVHCIVYHQVINPCFPNKVKYHEIDPRTLQEVK